MHFGSSTVPLGRQRATNSSFASGMSQVQFLAFQLKDLKGLPSESLPGRGDNNG